MRIALLVLLAAGCHGDAPSGPKTADWLPPGWTSSNKTSSGGGTGTVTSVATGTGLTGGPVTTSGTLSLNINGGTAQTATAGRTLSSLSGTGIITWLQLIPATGATLLLNNNGVATAFGGSTSSGCASNKAEIGLAASNAGVLSDNCAYFVNAGANGVTVSNNTASLTGQSGAAANSVLTTDGAGNNVWGTTLPGVTSVGSAGVALTFPQGPAGINAYGGTHLEWVEEFVSNPSNTDNFVTTASGTGATAALLTSGAGGTGARLGILQLEAGTTSSGYEARQTSASLYPGDWSATTYESTVGVPTLSTSSQGFSVQAGLFATVGSATQSAGCWFVYDPQNAETGGINSSNTQNWEAFSAASSTRTRVLLNGTSQDGSTGGAGSITTCTLSQSATTLPNTNFHTLKVVQNSTASCQFFVDESLCTTLTTNIPASGTAILAQTFILKNVGTTSETAYFDRHRLAIDLPSARSP